MCENCKKGLCGGNGCRCSKKAKDAPLKIQASIALAMQNEGLASEIDIDSEDLQSVDQDDDFDYVWHPHELGRKAPYDTTK